jgi:hypothetical protein
MQDIKECQKQIRELQNDTKRNPTHIRKEVTFWGNQEAEWKKRLPFDKECIVTNDSTTSQQEGNS